MATHPSGAPITREELERQAIYSELLRYCQNNATDKALKVANKILHEWPQDEIAFRCKVSCQVKKTNFPEALQLINDNPRLSSELQYELAYCYYRLQQMEKSKEVLDKWKDNSLRKQELMYQIHYRLDRLEEAYDMMLHVIKNSNDDLDEERQTNLSAVEAALKLENVERRIQSTPGSTYEMKYNNATGMIGEEKYIEAEALLLKVEKEAYDVLQDDGATDEDIADELGLVKAQRAYCAQILGRPKEAMALYTMVLKTKPSDSGLVAVASNNMLCINKEQNVFDSKKRVKSMTAEGVGPKLNDLQRRNILLNQSLFHLYTSNDETCKECCSVLDNKYPQFAEETLMIKAALISRSGGAAVAKQELQALLKQHPDAALKISLGLVQMALKNGDKNEAIALLKDLGKDYFRPGVISALVTLHQFLGNNVEAGKVLKEAVQHYRKSSSNKENMILLWRQTANFMMEQGDLPEAAKSLEELRKNSPDDRVTLAQLIVAYSQHDIVKAKSLSRALPSLEQPDVEVGVLESPNWLASVKQLKKGGRGDSVPTSPTRSVSVPSTLEEKEKKTVAKKKKKNKLPRNYEIDRKPDPERWLPKYERSTYRPKRQRKGRVDVGKGTQGADTAASAVYDMSSKVGQKEETTPVSSAGWRKDAHKKKKKKK